MSPLNKTDEPCEARNRERRARWALRQERWQLQAEKGSVPPLRGEQEAIGTPKAEAEDSGPFRPVCRTSSAPRSLGRLKGNRDPEPKKKMRVGANSRSLSKRDAAVPTGNPAPELRKPRTQ